MFELNREDETRGCQSVSSVIVRSITDLLQTGWSLIFLGPSIRWRRDCAHTGRLLVMCLCCVIQIDGAEAAKQPAERNEDGASHKNESEQLPPSPFKKRPQERKRIRYNSGAWNPLVDTTEVFPGNRNIDENGVFNLYDGAVGVRFRVEQADRSAPLLEAVAEWERGSSIGPLFIWNADDRWHMIYECTTAGKTCYATSIDGYQWHRPDLGQVNFGGSTKNNLLASGIVGATAVFLDPHAPPNERFKAMGSDMNWYDPDTLQRVIGPEAMRRWTKQQELGDEYQGPRAEIWGRTLGWVSSDGLDWKLLEESLGNRPVNGGISAYYDAHLDEYIGYLQIMGNTAELMPGIGTGQIEVETQRRTIGFSRTKDFRRWPAPKLILAPDGQDDLDISFYGANYFPYPGRTDLHAMIIPIYHQATEDMDSQIAFSRDGIFWYRPERRAVHTVGPPGSGDQCSAHPWRNGLVELPDGRWAVPYSANSTRHNVHEKDKDELFPERKPMQIRYMLWQPHRFCGIEAEVEGRFTIPTIYRHGNELRLNYRCAPGGWITVELLRARSAVSPDPDAIPGFAFDDCDRLIGDVADQVVTWNGNSDLSGIGGTAGIRIKMFQAKLFAYKL